MSVTKRQPSMRPQTLRRRRDILRAATQVFGSKGYTNGTLGDIADLVGMTHAGILHHFGTKDHLLLEVLTYRDETDVEDLAERHIPGGSEFFRHLVRTAFANAQRAGIVQSFSVLSGESVTDGHPAAQYFADRYATLRGEAQRAFRVMCAENGIAEPDTIEHASAAILAVMDGLQVQWLHNSTDVRLGEATEFAIEAIVSSVLSPQASSLR
ncbi:TetR/AcrR family transcriptional regulator [Tessaracoccus sp.]